MTSDLILNFISEFLAYSTVLIQSCLDAWCTFNHKHDSSKVVDLPDKQSLYDSIMSREHFATSLADDA